MAWNLRRLLPAAAALVVVMLAAGCTTTVHGEGSVAPVRHAVQVRTAEQLASFLLDVPDGAHRSTQPWAQDETPSIDTFADRIYDDSAGIDNGEYLRGLGITAVASRAWYTDDDTGMTMALLLFDSADQVPGWMTDANTGDGAGGLQPTTLATDPFIEGYTFPRPAAAHYTATRLYAANGRVGILAEISYPDAFDVAQAKEWITAQYDELG